MIVDTTVENPMNQCFYLIAMPSWGDIHVKEKPSPPRASNENNETWAQQIVQKIRRESRGSRDEGIKLSILKKE